MVNLAPSFIHQITYKNSEMRAAIVKEKCLETLSDQFSRDKSDGDIQNALEFLFQYGAQPYLEIID